MVHNRNGKGTCLHCKLFDDVEKIGKYVFLAEWIKDMKYFLSKNPQKAVICDHSDKSDI